MKKRMIQPVSAILVAAAVALAGCAGTPGAKRPQNLLSLDEAIAGAAEAVEAKVRSGTKIAIAEIDSPSGELSRFLNDKLSGRLRSGGDLTVLTRGESPQGVSPQFQLTGLVSDESAAGFGRYLGAKVVIIGTFSRLADDFSELRIRAVDVETVTLLAYYSTYIDNRDAVLAGVISPLANAPVATEENDLYHLTWGKDLIAEGRYDEAIEEFDKALALNRELSEVFFHRGYSYGRKGDYDRAITDYNEALRLDPNFALALFNRGYAYAAKEDYGRAIADFSEAIRLDPKDAYAYDGRGLAYYHRGDNDRAIADYSEAVRLDPKYADAYAGRGAAYYNKGDDDQAIADFSEAIRLDPNSVLALFNRGYAYSAQRDYDRAIADYSEVIRLDPNLAMAYHGRGLAYYVKGNNDRAIADYSEAIRIDANDADAYNGRGLAYYNKKDYTRARADWEKALQIDPGHTRARDNLERLRGY